MVYLECVFILHFICYGLTVSYTGDPCQGNYFMQFRETNSLEEVNRKNTYFLNDYSLEANHLILVWIMKVKGPKNQADKIDRS